MVAFTLRMPAGIAGSYNRVGAGHTVEAGILSGTATPAEYGHAVAYESGTGKYRAVTTSEVAANVAGVLLRAYPSMNYGSLVAGADPLGAVAVSALNGGVCNVMKRGYAMILLRAATAAAKGGAVYLRIATPGTNKVVGGFEAAADSTNTIVLPGWFFMGPADSLGNCEIGVNI